MRLTESTIIHRATTTNAYTRGKTAGVYDGENCFPYCPDSLQEEYQAHFEMGYNAGYENAREVRP